MAAAAGAAAFVDSRVTFEGVDGEMLVGTLRAPAARAAPAAAADPPPHQPPHCGRPKSIALLAHGYQSDRNTSVLVRLADALEARLGMASLRWDFSGNGESEGRFRYGCYAREAREIAAAAALARARGFRVALIAGHSKGATSALLYAGQACGKMGGRGGAEGGGDPREERGLEPPPSPLPPPPPRVVNLAGRFQVASGGVEERLGKSALAALERDGRVEGMRGWRGGGGVGGSVGEAFEWTLLQEDVEDRLSTDVGTYCAAVRRGRQRCEAASRVLSIHCEADAVVPAAEARLFHEALGGDAAGHRLVLVPGGDHSFRAPGAAEALVDEVVVWAAAEEEEGEKEVEDEGAEDR